MYEPRGLFHLRRTNLPELLSTNCRATSEVRERFEAIIASNMSAPYGQHVIIHLRQLGTYMSCTITQIL